MRYYHGSRNEFLRELTTDHYDGKLYVTDSYPMAVMYAGCSLRNWKYDRENDLLILYEVTDKAFEKMYKGRKCYIYTCEIEDAVKDEGNISNHTFKVNHNVLLNDEKEVIDDVYEKILSLEKEGKIKLYYFSDFSKEEQDIRRQRAINNWKPHMQNEFDNYREEYELLVNLFPELDLKYKDNKK